MPIKLSSADQEFRNRLINHIDNKKVDLDRMLVNLFALLKYNGQRPIGITARQVVEVPKLTERLLSAHGVQKGFDAYPRIVEQWLASDIVDMVNRGVRGKEAVASIRPLHLDAYKLRNLKHTRDYNASDQIFSLLLAADPEVISQLATYFGGTETDNLDLDALVVWRLVSAADLNDAAGSGRRELEVSPLAPAAAELLADDLRRLLAYREVVPRHVMLQYLKILLGIHLGLYMLRLFYLLPGFVAKRRWGGACPHCSDDNAHSISTPCRYRPLLLVDMGADYQSAMAELSRRDCATHFARINDYVKAVFTVNQLAQFLEQDYERRGRRVSIDEALNMYRNPPATFEPTFRVRVNQLFRNLEQQREEAEQATLTPRARTREMAQWAEIDAVRSMGLPPFETFIEVISYARTRFHREYMVEMLDSVLQKNSDGALLMQGRARSNQRRFHVGSGFLEVLVQLAVLEPDPTGRLGFTTRPILINEFLTWLVDRYGLVVNGLDALSWAERAGIEAPEWAARAGVRELEAYRDNVRALKGRLREIGFYTDLSDAYNAQSLQPRYRLREERP